MPELTTLPGSDILYRHWPVKDNKAVLLLVHGLGAHTARWNFLADFFVKKNIPSYAIELKGFGQTKDRPRGHIPTFEIYYRDILELTSFIKRENPSKKVFILAESLGGLIVFILACRYPEKYAGQILISPAFANGMKFPLTAYLNLLLLPFIPARTIPVPFTSEMCTRDTEYQKVMNNNPDEVRVASLKLLVNIMLAQFEANSLAKKLLVPSLFLISGKDSLIDENAGRKLFASLKLSDKSKIEYPEMLHALSIDLDREKVFADIMSWIEKRL